MLNELAALLLLRLDVLLEEILEKEADDKTAKEMRQKAMERMSQKKIISKKMTMVLRRKRPGEAHKNSSSFLKKKCPKPMLIKRKNFKSS